VRLGTRGYGEPSEVPADSRIQYPAHTPAVMKYQFPDWLVIVL
jgi:hypothetical protein